ncbi:RNA-directed DNA polymerase, eukaryota [Tanacetum coccineum]
MNGPHPTSQHPNSKNLHHISITIFVTNFPTTVSSKDLWKLCDRQGVVADVYIARKLSKSGRRFGFVRFIKNPDQANLLEDLNKIWIGSHHLFASIARFDRKQNSQPNQSHQKQSNNTKPHETGHASHTTGGRSYASVLNGKEGTQKPVLAGPITKNITLENSDLLELSDTSSVVLAKVRDVHLIINIYRVLKKEGFSDFKCKYMGGLWLWIEFSSDESRLKFQKNTEMELYFTQRKLVSHNFIPDERMIWIEIDGLPLNAWTTNAFKKIAGNWGETVFVDEDADENIANGRIPG